MATGPGLDRRRPGAQKSILRRDLTFQAATAPPAKANQAITRSKDDWVKEFFATYNSPAPIWMAVEAWDFGTLSWLLAMAHPNGRAVIAKRYGLLPQHAGELDQDACLRPQHQRASRAPLERRHHQSATGAKALRTTLACSYRHRCCAPEPCLWCGRRRQLSCHMPFATPAQGNFAGLGSGSHLGLILFLIEAGRSTRSSVSRSTLNETLDREQ